MESCICHVRKDHQELRAYKERCNILRIAPSSHGSSQRHVPFSALINNITLGEPMLYQTMLYRMLEATEGVSELFGPHLLPAESNLQLEKTAEGESEAGDPSWAWRGPEPPGFLQPGTMHPMHVCAFAIIVRPHVRLSKPLPGTSASLKGVKNALRMGGVLPPCAGIQISPYVITEALFQRWICDHPIGIHRLVRQGLEAVLQGRPIDRSAWPQRASRLDSMWAHWHGFGNKVDQEWLLIASSTGEGPTSGMIRRLYPCRIEPAAMGAAAALP